MTRGMLTLDRVAGVVAGLILVATSLLLLDWRYRLVGTYPEVVRADPLEGILESSWWPWAFAAVGLLLGVLALAWLLAHLRPTSPTRIRLGKSNQSGRLAVDMRDVAAVAADHLGSIAPLVGVRGSTRTHGSHTVVELRGHVDPAADPQALTDGAHAVTEQVRAAFPDDAVECRVLVHAPRPPRRGRSARARVH